MTTATDYIIVNAGTTREREEVVKPLAVRGDKTLVAYVRGAAIATKFVKTSRIIRRS